MDMSQYLDLFLEESLEHLQNLNKGLLELEDNPYRTDSLDEVFRAAHTLKGMSATMGYDSIAQLTHKMENLLDKVRERKLEFRPEIFNCLFKAVDAMENMLASIRKGDSPNFDVRGLTVELEALESGKASAVPEIHKEVEFEALNMTREEDLNLILNEYEKDLLKTIKEKGMRAWQIKVLIDESCLMKGVRAFMVFKGLETLGEIIKSEPPVQDLEDEKFQNEFFLILVTDQEPQVIKETLQNISEVTPASIKEINPLAQEKMSITPEIRPLPSQTEERPGTEVRAPLPSSNIAQGPNPGVQEQAGTGDKKQKLHQTVRVDISRLDKLMSLVGELVINKTRLEQIFATNNMAGLNEAIEQINRITTNLQAVVQNVRMVSIEQVFNRFPRMVRDLAKDLGKEVNLTLEGKETELDRTVIDEIGDPLVHLIRNAIDHGLELPADRIKANKSSEGMLKLTARHEGNRVIIHVEDDGHGINTEAVRKKALQNGLITASQAESMDDASVLNLIFEPGFSTASTITDISGRGVGLDVVKKKIQALSGQVSVETRPGQGTRFLIKLPLTLAIIQALLVKVQNEVYAIPLGNIDETTSLEIQQIKNIQGQQVMVLREKVLPLVFLREILSVPGDEERSEMYVVVVRKGDQQIGLIAEELVGQQEIVINSLGNLVAGIPGLAGASILGDGTISLILDIGTLF